MPMDAQQAAMWNQSMQTATQAAGVIAQNKLNRKTREWNEKMVNQQREWALADWNMQNEYNSPAAQMARLKAAGLNPNLVYGHGAEAMSASPPRSVSNNSWNPKVPDFSAFGQSLTSGMDLQLKNAQLENMKVQNQLLQTENLRKLTDIGRMETGMGLTEAQTDRLKQLIAVYGEYGMKQAEAELNSTIAKTAFTVDENERQKLKNASDLLTAVQIRLNYAKQREYQDQLIDQSKQWVGESKSRQEHMTYQNGEIVQKLEYIREQINNAKGEGWLKALEIQLKENGFTWSDGVYWRQLYDGIRQYKESHK